MNDQEDQEHHDNTNQSNLNNSEKSTPTENNSDEGDINNTLTSGITPKEKKKSNQSGPIETGKAVEGEVLESVPIERVEEYLNAKYIFRHNVLTARIEYKTLDGPEYLPITSNALNSLWRELTKARRPCSVTTLQHLLSSDFSTAYDPLVSYLEGLPGWDRETDYIDQLANTVATTNPEFFKICLEKWLVAMVACWINPDVVNQTVLVFSGGQGIGKTTWINNLVPPELKSLYFSGTINPKDKDTLIHLAESCLINLDELENLNKTEVGALKEIISKSHIKVRRAYGVYNENYTRRASFAGSVNASQFLNDTTGSRRFLCFEATSFEKNHGVDMRLVYSQAYALSQIDYQYWFDQEEIAAIEENNRQYQKSSMEEELLLQTFEPCSRDEATCLYLNATEIGAVLTEVYKVPLDQYKINQLGKILHKHGFERVKKKDLMKYCVRRTDTITDTEDAILKVA